MSFGLRFTFNDGPLSSAIAALRDRGEDLGAPLREIGEDMVTVAQRSFELHASPQGVIWKPSWRAINEGGTTLVKSGRLRDFITYLVDAAAAAVEVGSNTFYARIHQLGGTIRAKGKALRFRLGKDTIFVKSVTLPPRPFIGASPTDVDRWADIARDYVAGFGPSGARTGGTR